MVLFTMLMGNAFAAFTVITASIGIPFVIAQGGDPIVAGALAMTGGFCGTLHLWQQISTHYQLHYLR